MTTMMIGSVIRDSRIPRTLPAPCASNAAALVTLLRPKQWVKNTFVSAGVIFGGQLQNPDLVRSMLLAVIAFCLMGSSVYVLNDYLDREADRGPPQESATGRSQVVP